MTAGPHPVDVTRTGLDPYQVVPQVLELLFGKLRTCRADGHHANYCGNADCDPDCRQRAPHLVARERADGLTDEET